MFATPKAGFLCKYAQQSRLTGFTCFELAASIRHRSRKHRPVLRPDCVVATLYRCLPEMASVFYIAAIVVWIHGLQTAADLAVAKAMSMSGIRIEWGSTGDPTEVALLVR